VDSNDLVRRYPEVYHMAELGSWSSIQKHGLLSTTALLDLFDVHDSRRFELESRWRPWSVTVRHPTHGTAVIRDQRPMPESELRPLLTNIEPRGWYELINGKVFFWADLYGLKKLLGAVMYRSRSHDVLTVSTRALVDRHIQKMWLTDQNTGSSISGRARGVDTFKRVTEFGSRWVTEVAIDYSVPDVADLTIRVEEWKGDSKVRDIWSRELAR
jgi:hypothetical protein